MLGDTSKFINLKMR